MLPGMKDTPWWLWLLIGCAIVPMLIPVWRRYQVVRLRLTPPPRHWGLKNVVPARLERRSSYLTPQVHLERRHISRIWLALVITNLIAIPVLTVLAGFVYNRIVIDWLRPPVYSIRVRPALIWHRTEFVISPSYGVLMTIDARITFSYFFQNAGSYDARRQQNDQWRSEDRPRLVASYIERRQGIDQYDWVFTNVGKEDATNIRIKMATIDLNRTQHASVSIPVLLRLKPGMVYPVATGPEKGSQYLVICAAYSNDRGTPFADVPQFYYAPLYMKSTETRAEPALVPPLLDVALSAGFYCGSF
jgi:hypothetical protein